jgi:hypothetical protein
MFDPKDFINRNALEPDAIYNNGFNLCLFEIESKSDFNKSLTQVLDDYKRAFAELSSKGIESQIDIGPIRILGRTKPID